MSGGGDKTLPATGGGGEKRLPNIIYWLSGALIGVAGLNAIAMEIWFSSPTIAQYRITIIFLCFALSSIGGLLFASNAKLTGTLGVVSVTLGGAAILWLGALLVIYNVFPEKTVEDTNEAAIQLRIKQAVDQSKAAPQEVRFQLVFPPDPNNPQLPDPRSPRGFDKALKITGYLQHDGSADNKLEPAFHFITAPGGLTAIFPSVKTFDQLQVVTDDGINHWQSYTVSAPPQPALQMVLGEGKP